MLDHSCQVQRHTHAERGHDLYETPPEAVRALLRVETLPLGAVWEPACGRGAIAEVLKAAGYPVWPTDLVDYGYGTPVDFLGVDAPPVGTGCILTNPPFKIANQFVNHALHLHPRVYMLLRLAFYESVRRSPILENCGLKRVYVFRKRLPMMHRDGWEGRKANSGMAFAWFCWDNSYVGPTELHRISWE